MRNEAVLERVRNTLTTAGCTLPELGSTEDREATRRWNGALQPRPALVARCATTAQVSTIVPMRNPIAHTHLLLLRSTPPHSHSMVPDGFDVTSQATQ
jgi:hypothetical protein